MPSMHGFQLQRIVGKLNYRVLGFNKISRCPDRIDTEAAQFQKTVRLGDDTEDRICGEIDGCLACRSLDRCIDDGAAKFNAGMNIERIAQERRCYITLLKGDSVRLGDRLLFAEFFEGLD